MKKSKNTCPFCGAILPKDKRLRNVVRITEAALMIGCSTKTVERRTDEGKIRCISRRKGSHRRYAKAEIERYITSLEKKKR